MTLQDALKSEKWFVRPDKNGRFKYFREADTVTAEFAQVGTNNYQFSPSEVLNDGWVLEPCKHEPEYMIDENFIVYDVICKQCQKRIQANEWVEV